MRELLRIAKSWDALSNKMEKCPTCGLQFLLVKDHELDLEVVPSNEKRVFLIFRDPTGALHAHYVPYSQGEREEIPDSYGFVGHDCFFEREHT